MHPLSKSLQTLVVKVQTARSSSEPSEPFPRFDCDFIYRKRSGVSIQRLPMTFESYTISFDWFFTPGLLYCVFIAITITSFRLEFYLTATPQTKLKAYAAIERELYVPLPLKRQGDDAHWQHEPQPLFQSR